VANAAQLPNIKTLGWAPFRTDFFGRTKVSNPQTIFEAEHIYTPSGKYNPEAGGNGSWYHVPEESVVDLKVTGVLGDRVTTESRRVIPYQPGKALQIMESFTMAPPQLGLRQRVGYFSRKNGIFLERLGDQTFFVLRYEFNGSVAEIRAPQSEWNIDPLDGTGDTSLVLDLTKSQILWMEIEWLGVGSVRAGFAYNGNFITAHQFDHANFKTSTYMRTASLPLRYEIENMATNNQNSIMKHICSVAISNGGFDDRPERQNISREMAVGTTLVPVYAIRMAEGREDSVIIPGPDQIVPTAAGNFKFFLLRNPTLTGGTYVLYGKGNVEFNLSATAVSGGEVLQIGYATGTNQTSSPAEILGNDRFDLQLGRTNSDTPVSDVICLAIQTLSGNSSIAVVGSWYDLL
jgi:hypothetical protein